MAPTRHSLSLSLYSLCSLFPSPFSAGRARGRRPRAVHSPRPVLGSPEASRPLHAALFPSAHAEDGRRRATATNAPSRAVCQFPARLRLCRALLPSFCFANEPSTSPSTPLPAPRAETELPAVSRAARCPPLAPPPLGRRGAHPSGLPRAQHHPQLAFLPPTCNTPGVYTVIN